MGWSISSIMLSESTIFSEGDRIRYILKLKKLFIWWAKTLTFWFFPGFKKMRVSGDLKVIENTSNLDYLRLSILNNPWKFEISKKMNWKVRIFLSSWKNISLCFVSQFSNSVSIVPVLGLVPNYRFYKGIDDLQCRKKIFFKDDIEAKWKENLESRRLNRHFIRFFRLDNIIFLIIHTSINIG